nr:unnamed protein product [Digitaria exilis]
MVLGTLYSLRYGMVVSPLAMSRSTFTHRLFFLASSSMALPMSSLTSNLMVPMISSVVGPISMEAILNAPATLSTRTRVGPLNRLCLQARASWYDPDKSTATGSVSPPPMNLSIFPSLSQVMSTSVPLITGLSSSRLTGIIGKSCPTPQ